MVVSILATVVLHDCDDNIDAIMWAIKMELMTATTIVRESWGTTRT